MATLDTIKLTKKETKYKWVVMDNLATNSNIPDDSGYYALQRAHQKLYPIVKPMIERRSEVDKKMLERDKKNGRFTGNLNEGVTPEEFEKAIEQIESQELIDVEIYKIKLSSLKGATIVNNFGKETRIPPAVITDLQEWIIFDVDENEQTEEKPEKEVDIPRKVDK